MFPASNTFLLRRGQCVCAPYHSVALLLPDATVWLAGGNPNRGNYESHIEVYQPAYFSNPMKPGDSPDHRQRARQYQLRQSVHGANAGRGKHHLGGAHSRRRIHALLWHGSAHGGNVVHGGHGSLTVTAPPNGNIAPPGYYMLFLLNSQGVPSVSTFVLLKLCPPPPCSCADSDFHTRQLGICQRRHGSDDQGHGIPAGCDGKLGGTAATGVTVVSSTSITATTPAHAAGAVDVVVRTPTVRVEPSGGFTYASASGGGIGFVQAASGPATFSHQTRGSRAVSGGADGWELECGGGGMG